jgi:hypothetical protein
MIIKIDQNKLCQLFDGDGIKPSANGIWIYTTKSYEIYDSMMFKVGKSKYKICFKKKAK